MTLTMMPDKSDISDSLGEHHILLDLSVRTKKQALETICSHAANQIGCDEHNLLNVILEREQLGSTASDGAAVPHCRLGCLTHHTCILAKLATPIDFEADDDQPVDLILLFLAPETSGQDCQHAYSRVMRKLCGSAEKLRAASRKQDLVAALQEVESTLERL